MHLDYLRPLETTSYCARAMAIAAAMFCPDLPPDQVAVTYDEEVGYQILLPPHDEDDTMPESAAVLIAVAMRLTDDREFYQDVVEWLETRQV